MDQAVSALTPLPCPFCRANLLEKGFYNFCLETTALRGENYLYGTQGRIYVDHNADAHETLEHECEAEARCRECNEPLPWALYELRDLNSSTPGEVEKTIAALIERAKEKGPAKESES